MSFISKSILCFVFIAACKPQASLKHPSEKSTIASKAPEKDPLNDYDPILTNPFPDLETTEQGETETLVENAPREEEIPNVAHGLDVSKCKEFKPSDGASCKSHFNAVSWKLKKMSGDCSKKELEMFCYEASSSSGTFKGAFYSYCNGYGKGAEYKAAQRETRKYW